MFSSVRWPLTLAFFLLTVICVGSTEVVLFQSVRRYYLATVEEGLTQDCTLLANLMSHHMDQVALTPAERKMITDEMNRLSVRLPGRVCIVNWRGQVLEDSARRTGEILSHRPEIASALEGRADVAVGGDHEIRGEDAWDELDEPTVYAAVPMRAKGKVTGAICATRSIADLQLFLFNLRELLYKVAAGSLFLSLLFSLLLAGWLTAPLRRLAGAATRFGEGHLDERIEHRRKDELGALGDSFNAMAESLKTQQDSLLRFISDASHELKTPVSSLRSLVEALEGGALEKPEAATRFLGFIHHDLDRMERLVKDLLQLHKIDRQVVLLDFTTVDLNEFFRAFGERHQGLEGGTGTPKVVIRVVPGEISVDVPRFEQVLANLLENARRAVRGRPDAHIGITASPEEIVFEDNGVGLAPADLERIFDRFYRVDSARSREDGGTGLGLTITRGLVEAMGGRLIAESEGLGKGARFRVLLGASAQ